MPLTNFNLSVPNLRSDYKMDLLANPVVKAFLAGSFSGTCTTILFQPLDLVKTRIQSSKSDKRLGMFSVARQVLETDRLPGLWRGIAPSIARTVPGVGLYFGSLHWLKTASLGPGVQPSASEASEAMSLCRPRLTFSTRKSRPTPKTAATNSSLSVIRLVAF